MMLSPEVAAILKLKRENERLKIEIAELKEYFAGLYDALYMGEKKEREQ